MISSRSDPASPWRWAGLLAVAEAVGMAAAAAASRMGTAVVGEPQSAGDAAVVVALVTAGGLVEGLAVGIAGAVALARTVPSLPRRRWIAVTAAVAGLGWAAGSLPAQLAAADTGSAAATAGPSVWLVLAGAVGIGVLMGAVLGLAQAAVLRGHVRHPWRWVTANAAAWAPAMLVIFAGATSAGAGWHPLAVVGLAAATGTVAGAALGAVLGWAAGSLAGPPASGRILALLLASPAHRLVPDSLVALSVRGTRSGTWHEFPVIAAPDGEALVVVPGGPERKRWWRNLLAAAPVVVTHHGVRAGAAGRVLAPGDPAYERSLRAYRDRHPGITVGPECPVVRLTFDRADAARITLPHDDAHEVRSRR